MDYDVAIVGGGISGLSAAFFLKLKNPRLKLCLLESSPKLGGLISSYQGPNGIMEEGPYLFTSRGPACQSMLSQLGTRLAFQKADVSQGRRYVLKEKKLWPFPQNLWELVKSPILSYADKWELVKEPMRPAVLKEESLKNFGLRRLGRGFSQHFLEPMAASIFASSAEKLSAELIAGNYKNWERQYGSITKAMWAQSFKKPLPLFAPAPLSHGLYFKGGMESFVSAIESWLLEKNTTLLKNTPVFEIKKNENCYSLLTSQSLRIKANKLVLSTPAHCIANMFPELSKPLKTLLESIQYAALATYYFSFPASQKLPPGFGFFVPTLTQTPITSGVFLSNLFPHVMEKGRQLLSVQLAKTMNLQNIEEEKLYWHSHIKKQLPSFILPANSELERFVYLPQGMPVYSPFHKEKCSEIEKLLKQQLPNLYINQSFLTGSGLERCMEQSQQLSEKLHQSVF